MNDVYSMNNIFHDIIGCKFALVSKFLKIQNTNKEELINIRGYLSKIGELEKAMMNHDSIDIDSLEIIKEYVMGTKPEYRVKTK